MRSNHYCDDCETHFRASMEKHAEVYHDGGLFRGIEGGDWRDYQRREDFRIN